MVTTVAGTSRETSRRLAEGNVVHRLVSPGDSAKIGVGNIENTRRFDVRRHTQNRICRIIIPLIKRPHIVQRGLPDMVRREPYRRPAVGVHLVHQVLQQQPHVAIRLVQIPLVVLLDHHPLFGLQFPRRDVEPRHPVGLQPQRRGHILHRQGYVIVRIITIGKRVVLGGGFVQRCVEVGHGARTAKHQMLEQVCETRPTGVFVSRADAIQHVHRGHPTVSRLVRHHPQPAPQNRLVVRNHFTKIDNFNTFVFIFRSLYPI